MQTFVLLTCLISEEVNPSFTLQKKELDIKQKVKKYCPQVEWVSDYAVVGPWDYLDIFKAPDIQTAMQVSALVRYYGGSHTELWPLLQWRQFKTTMQVLSQVMEKD